MKTYKKLFKENIVYFNPKNKTQLDVVDTILKVLERDISVKTVGTAYDLYSMVCKAVGKNPIEMYKFLSDTTKEDSLKTETWIEIFFNSALFDLLGVYKEHPTLSDFAKKALKDKSYNSLKYKFMKLVYDKKPKNINDLEKIVGEVK